MLDVLTNVPMEVALAVLRIEFAVLFAAIVAMIWETNHTCKSCRHRMEMIKTLAMIVFVLSLLCIFFGLIYQAQYVF